MVESEDDEPTFSPRRRASSLDRGTPDKFGDALAMSPFMEITKSRRQSLSTSALHQIRKPGDYHASRKDSIIGQLMPQKSHVIKVLLVGDEFVGKSAFLVRLVTGRFLSHYASDIDMTAECDLLSDENDKVKLHITDPAGSLTYTNHNLLASIKSHEIVLLLFDISNESSFDWAESHAALIASQKKTPPSVVLLGTKLDLDFRREIDEERARQLADKFGWHYFEVSTADQSLMDMKTPDLIRSIITEFIAFKKYTQPKRRSSVQNIIRGSINTIKGLTSSIYRTGVRRATELPMM